MRTTLFAAAVVAQLGCAMPALVFHTYSFSGSVIDQTTGLPVSGARVLIEARTAPFERFGSQMGSGITDNDGTFRVEIVEMFCHTLWVCPPLGMLGGSEMNDLKEVRLILKNADDTRLDTVLPVMRRRESQDRGFRIEHSLPPIGLPTD